MKKGSLEIIDDVLLNSLSNNAKENTRLRMHMDMRNSQDDTSQRMLNAIEPDANIPIHRNRVSSESIILLRGQAKVLLYNDDSTLKEECIMSGDRGIYGVSIPAGCYHTVISLQPNTVIFEAKDGRFMPVTPEDLL